MLLPRFILAIVLLQLCATGMAQSPAYNIGKTPSADDLRAADLFAGPAGKELPPGKGTAKEGAKVYAEKCFLCHGQDGEGTKLVSERWKWKVPRVMGEPLRSDRYPFATTLWSYINSAMPRNPTDITLRGAPLTADEVYALTAYLLYRSSIIQESDVMDAASLPKVSMPGRNRHLERLAPRANTASN